MAKAEDLLRLVRVAEGSSSSNVQRCVDALNELRDIKVTSKLLVDTGAGKKVRRLSKHEDAAVGTAAGGVVSAWRALLGVDGKSSGKSSPKKRNGEAGGPKTDAQDSPHSPRGVKREREPEKEAAKPAEPSRPAPSRDFQEAPATGDKARDSLRKSLGDAILQAFEEDDPDDQNPFLVGADIEDTIFEKYHEINSDYKAKVRTILFNLKDKKNPDFRRRLLIGEIAASAVVSLSSEDMASDEKRKENNKIRAHMKRETERCENAATSETNMWKCSKCHKRRCSYYQMQTRSADEPMTTFVRCLECNHRWKFC